MKTGKDPDGREADVPAGEGMAESAARPVTLRVRTQVPEAKPAVKPADESRETKVSLRKGTEKAAKAAETSGTAGSYETVSAPAAAASAAEEAKPPEDRRQKTVRLRIRMNLSAPKAADKPAGAPAEAGAAQAKPAEEPDGESVPQTPDGQAPNPK